MRPLLKHSGSWEGFRPPADEAVFALRTRLTNEPKDEKHLPRWMLAFACCFAIGVWLAVAFMIAAPEPTLQFARWSEATIKHWSGAMPTKTIVQRPAKRPTKSSAVSRNCDAAQRPLVSCEQLPRKFRYSLR